MRDLCKAPPRDKHAPCPAFADQFSPRGFCSAHERTYLRDAAIEYRRRVRTQGEACANAWCNALTLPIAAMQRYARELPEHAKPYIFQVQ